MPRNSMYADFVRNIKFAPDSSGYHITSFNDAIIVLTLISKGTHEHIYLVEKKNDQSQIEFSAGPMTGYQIDHLADKIYKHWRSNPESFKDHIFTPEYEALQRSLLKLPEKIYKSSTPTDKQPEPKRIKVTDKEISNTSSSILLPLVKETEIDPEIEFEIAKLREEYEHSESIQTTSKRKFDSQQLNTSPTLFTTTSAPSLFSVLNYTRCDAEIDSILQSSYVLRPLSFEFETNIHILTFTQQNTTYHLPLFKEGQQFIVQGETQGLYSPITINNLNDFIKTILNSYRFKDYIFPFFTTEEDENKARDTLRNGLSSTYKA